MEWLNLIPDFFSLSGWQLLFLIFIAFSGGFVDAVVGGGGLISLPGLMAIFPSFPIPAILGTNKLAGISGTSTAALKFASAVPLQWRWLLPAFIGALCCAILGGKIATLLPTAIFRPLILIFLLWTAYMTFFRKASAAAPNATEADGHGLLPDNRRARRRIVLVCALIGLYDGFIGPGTGIFLIFAFVHFQRMNFLTASAHAKVINVASNIGALVYFIPAGHFMWKVAIVLMICNIGGAYLGSSLAITKGSRFIAVFFRLMVAALLIKFISDTFMLMAH